MQGLQTATVQTNSEMIEIDLEVGVNKHDRLSSLTLRHKLK